jgi:hypothetical protein
VELNYVMGCGGIHRVFVLNHGHWCKVLRLGLLRVDWFNVGMIQVVRWVLGYLHDQAIGASDCARMICELDFVALFTHHFY